MFTPEMMEAAQKMMANMTPEQMSQIAGMASKMDPRVLENMSKGNGGLPMPSKSQFEEAKDRMKNMSPEQMQGMFDEAKTRMSGQNSYMVSGATLLKNEGNDQVRAGDYSAAIETFQKGISNLETCTTPDEPVITLLQSLRLNTALCYLKLEDFHNVIATCDTVLNRDPRSVKALYRRGVAKRELGEILVGAKDLKLATMLCSNSDHTIQAEYEKTVSQIYDASELEQLESVAIGESQPTSQSVPNLSKAKEIIESNPDVMDRMGDMLSNMDEDQLNGILEMSAAGMPGDQKPDLGEMKKILKNKDFMKSMTEMMKNMDMDQVSKLVGGGSGVTTQASGTSQSSVSAPVQPDLASMFKDGSSLRQISKMVDSMPDSVLEDMLGSQMGGKGSLPSFLTGSRMKMVIKAFLGLLRVWIFIRQAFALLWSRNGKILMTILVILIGVYYQYGKYIFPHEKKEDDEHRLHEGL
jgi:tetratricopeptide (TPR) repeat protein